MSLEQKINYRINNYPAIKKIVKWIYQHGMYYITKKIKSEGNITRISPDDQKQEYFFGYYDKSPWDITDRFMLCLRANDTHSDVSPREKADILLIDTMKAENDSDRVKKIAETRAWNVQQSCMLQWLGPDYSSRILYNDYRDENYCSVILTLSTMEEKLISTPVYAVSTDGIFALTLDFSRLYELCPGYGYYNVPERTKGIALPDTAAIWSVNLNTGEFKGLIKYIDFANFQPRPEMKKRDSVHKVNHIMISPNGKRFLVLYRWFVADRKYTRLITCNIDGTDMYLLSDDDMVSHCFWKDDSHIIAFENKKKCGIGYYLMKDKTDKYYHCWPELTGDGHPSFSLNNNLVVTDTYPDRARIAYIKVMDGDVRKTDVKIIAKVFAPFKYDNDTRCDLHPRWNHKGNKICFDSVFEGHRGLYTVGVEQGEEHTSSDGRIQSAIISQENSNDIKYSIVTPVYNSYALMECFFDSLKKQIIQNFEVILVDDGSTDGSYKKLLEYQKTSELNIRVLSTGLNSGPGYARNVGMDVAVGEWITFLDNDDWIEPTFFSEIDAIVEKNDINCVIYDLFYQTEKYKHIISSMYHGEEGMCSIEEGIKFARNHSVGKVYRLQTCRDKAVRFPQLRRCEDIGFTCRAIDACGSIYYYKKPLYHYVQRPTSLSNNYKLDEIDMVNAFTVIEDSLREKYPNAIQNKSVTDLLYGGVLLMCKAGKKRQHIKKFIMNYEKKYPDWTSAEIKNHIGIEKRLFLKAIEMKAIVVLKVMTYVHSMMIRG